MSTGGSGRGRAPLSEINVTPLVDVMLVLLIIFMVAAPMMTAGVEVDLPRAEAPRMEIDEEKPLLSITADQRIMLGETEVPIGRLEQTLARNARIQREHELYVRADENVRYGFVVQVLAIVRRAGVQQLGLVTNPLGSAGSSSEGATPATPVPAPSGPSGGGGQ